MHLICVHDAVYKMHAHVRAIEGNQLTAQVKPDVYICVVHGGIEKIDFCFVRGFTPTALGKLSR